jgi:hypothetical protein
VDFQQRCRENSENPRLLPEIKRYPHVTTDH